MKNKERIAALEKTLAEHGTEIGNLIEENTALRQRLTSLETWKTLPTAPLPYPSYPYPVPASPPWYCKTQTEAK